MGNTIHIIFDNRRQEKYQPLINTLTEQGITDYKIWPCIMVDNVVESINLSHKRLVKYAKDIDADEITIGEDDLMFTSPNAWQYYLGNKPKDFDLYLAATYIVPTSNKKICGFHLYTVRKKFYDKFLSMPDDVHCDTYMDELGGDYHFCYPFPALQRPGFSANNKAVVDYNKVLSPQDIYQG